MNRMNIPKFWPLPKYTLGQRVEQGEIVGIEYRSPGTYRANELGQGWFYQVLPDEYSESVEIYREKDIELASSDFQNEIFELIINYQNRIFELIAQLKQ